MIELRDSRKQAGCRFEVTPATSRLWVTRGVENMKTGQSRSEKENGSSGANDGWGDDCHTTHSFSKQKASHFSEPQGRPNRNSLDALLSDGFYASAYVSGKMQERCSSGILHRVELISFRHGVLAQARLPT